VFRVFISESPPRGRSSGALFCLLFPNERWSDSIYYAVIKCNPFGRVTFSACAGKRTSRRKLSKSQIKFSSIHQIQPIRFFHHASDVIILFISSHWLIIALLYYKGVTTLPMAMFQNNIIFLYLILLFCCVIFLNWLFYQII
jgi:hypothetical protein